MLATVSQVVRGVRWLTRCPPRSRHRRPTRDRAGTAPPAACGTRPRPPRHPAVPAPGVAAAPAAAPPRRRGLRARHLHERRRLPRARDGGGRRGRVVIAAAAWRLLSGDGPALLRSRALLPALAVLVAVSLSAVFATDQRLAAAGWVRWVEVDVLLPVATFVVCRTVRAVAGFLGTLGVPGRGRPRGRAVPTGTGAGYGAEAIRARSAPSASATSWRWATSSPTPASSAWPARSRPARAPHRLVAGALAVFFLLPLLLSLSRGALLSGLVAAVLVLARVGWRVLAGTALAGIASRPSPWSRCPPREPSSSRAS